MNKLHYMFIVILLINNICCLNQDIFDIEGIWLEEGVYIECPHSILFKSDGSYEVYNDCFGDARNPIIQQGNYTINNKRLTLYNRKNIHSGNSIIFSSVAKQLFDLKEKNSTHIELKSNDTTIKLLKKG